MANPASGIRCYLLIKAYSYCLGDTLVAQEAKLKRFGVGGGGLDWCDESKVFLFHMGMLLGSRSIPHPGAQCISTMLRHQLWQMKDCVYTDAQSIENISWKPFLLIILHNSFWLFWSQLLFFKVIGELHGTRKHFCFGHLEYGITSYYLLFGASLGLPDRRWRAAWLWLLCCRSYMPCAVSLPLCINSMVMRSCFFPYIYTSE